MNFNLKLVGTYLYHFDIFCTLIYIHIFNFQNLYKKMKGETKKVQAIERRERFQTGGGSAAMPSNSVSNELLNTLLIDQQPLTGIEDDDHLDSGK